MNKKVKFLIPAYDINMGGIMLKQALPTNNVEKVDPFLLLHHGSFKFRKNGSALHQGIGPHPHRGFSPVTFVIDGEVHHRDSWGNSQIAKKGEVQWINAGAGIIHSERPSQKLVDENAKQEIVQLWINIPARKKMLPPKYQYLSGDKIPVFLSEDKSIQNKLIAGSYAGLRGKIATESELLIIWGSALLDGIQQFTIEEGFNCMLYLIRGELKISAYGVVEKESLVVFEEGGNEIGITLKAETQFLLLCGKAINEKIVQQGPYVMNSTTEIMEAMRDYQMGKMGILIEE